ncbi:MAG: sigma-54-dependent transcriptional regulator [Treponema sp.]
MKFRVLVVDDEKNIREGLQMALEDDGYEVLTAADGSDGLKYALSEAVDLIITDLRMPGLSGQELLHKVSSESPGVPVIVLTGHGTVETAVEAMRMGAYDFLTKPVDLDRLSLLVKRALQTRELMLQHRELMEQMHSEKAFEHIIGKSAEMGRVFEMVRKAAPSRASVLITGESGVGKELIASAIHNLSPRRDKSYVKVHCAALAESLLESELFGHEKGAYTGAVSQKRGRFELADNGSIFLDEIGEINQSLQIKILRVLQERQFERVGGEKTISVDTRIITATNRDLEAEVAAGRFRNDLYYRLNVVHIHVPALRERKEDLPLLIAAFIKEFAEENNKIIAAIEPKARAALYSYDWPGNIRQLRNCLESAVVMSSDTIIRFADLPEPVRRAEQNTAISIQIGSSLKEAEQQVILETLAAYNGNKSKTADVLQIGRKTLHRKLEDITSAADITPSR